MAKKSIEESLLLRSHSEERTKELLSTRYSISGDQKPFLVLTPTKGNNKSAASSIPTTPLTSTGIKKISKKGKKTQFQNAREALNGYISSAKKSEKTVIRKLKSDKYENIDQIPTELLEKIPKYEDFQQLQSLWRLYISDLIYGTSTQDTPTTNTPSRSHDLLIASKLATADFHGAKLRVVSSHNPTLVGLEGIVIWEAKSSFIIVVDPKNTIVGGLRIINKKGTRFKLTVYQNESDQTGYEYEIIGSRFLYRTADRSSRKFKSHNINDL